MNQQDSTVTASGSGPEAPAPEEHITLAPAASVVSRGSSMVEAARVSGGVQVMVEDN